MSHSPFTLEFDGTDYVIFYQYQVVAAFSNLEDAYNAKFDFEHRPVLSPEEKTPPAMRWAKEHQHLQSA